jgi:outer membrane protein OmpA-like peptidoglycan-associated protein
VQYRFSIGFPKIKKHTSKEVDYLNKTVNENRSLIEILEKQQNLLDKLDTLQKCCDEKVVTKVTKTSLPGYIRFALNSYTIEQSEQHKLINIVDYLKNTPDVNILLVGYADRKTGNPKYNWELSYKRVNAVITELERFGIDSSRLIIGWKGDKEQPFTPNEWNRVVIILESN